MADHKPKLSTAADFLQRESNQVVDISENQSVRIQAIPKMDFFIGYGSHLATKMEDAGMDFNDENARDKFVEGLTEKVARELIRANWLGIQQNVCKSVQSINLVLDRPDNCTEDQVSIEELADIDIYTIWRRVNVLSGRPDPGDTRPMR